MVGCQICRLGEYVVFPTGDVQNLLREATKLNCGHGVWDAPRMTYYCSVLKKVEAGKNQ
jgi:hypothetical protein